MSRLDSSVRELCGVGEVSARRYAALGIRTIGDLLCHYPRGYEDRGNVKLLCESDGVTKSAFVLTVATQPKSVRIKGRMSLTKLRAYDDSASCEIIFFNQEYLKNTFTPGSEYRFYGRAEVKNGRITLTSPAYEYIGESTVLRPLIPVYPLTEGLTQKQVSKDVRAAMALANTLCEEDVIPYDTLARNRLCTRSYAIKNIHEPQDMEALEAARRRLIFDELFGFALGISMVGAKRQRASAHPCRVADIRPLERVLPFRLTEAQVRVIDEIRADMSRESAMGRIIIGDVGSGKTVCAVAAMLFSVQSGHQALLMAPTEILAQQHFKDISTMLGDMGVRCELLLGATSAANKRRIRAALAAADPKERIDIVVGTQALLSEGVDFADLGLAVVDEQHRFGVRQRSEFMKNNPMCHMLVMSATPIPRTLALTIYGDLDVSRIDRLPAGRKPVDTFVVDESLRERLDRFIEKQVALGGQVYVVCPAVEQREQEDEVDLDMSELAGELCLLCEDEDSAYDMKSALKWAEELSKRLPGIKIDCLHGKMRAAEKEEKMLAFVSGQTKVLVCTTVIEVGVNVPNASLMIIENAERFGLSQLHQLRGRVGRGERQSFCVLVSQYAKKEGRAKERLLTIRDNHDGMSIAEKDLAMRGPGDFLGRENDEHMRQSGGVRFKLAAFCEDTELMESAFKEAKALVAADPDLEEHPALKTEVERIFMPDESIVN